MEQKLLDLSQVDISKTPLNADALNAQLVDEAKKQGVELPRDDKGRFVSTEAKKEESKKDPEPEVIEYKVEVEVAPGKTIFVTGKSEEDVRAKAEIAEKAIKAAIAKAEEKKPVVEAKPLLTADELAKLGTDLQAGKVEAVEQYIEKSGVLDRYFEKKGVNLEEVKETLKEKQTQSETESWQSATEEFKSEHSEYVGTKRNQVLIGYKIVELMSQDKELGKKDAIEKAYLALKSDEMLDVEPPKTELEKKPEPVKKKQTASTIIGSGAEPGTRRETPKETAAGKLTDEQIKNMKPQDLADWYNHQVKQQLQTIQ